MKYIILLLLALLAFTAFSTEYEDEVIETVEVLYIDPEDDEEEDSDANVTSTPILQPKGSPSFTKEHMRLTFPGITQSRIDNYYPYLVSAMEEGNINTCLRRAAFIAQLGMPKKFQFTLLGHESASLRYMEEIASGAAYEGRKDLGNIYPGDGRRYKGRGPIQLTGRANYRAAGRDLGIDLEGNPQLAATPQVGFRVAVWFWTTRNLNYYADRGEFATITRRINGGQNGRADRESRYNNAKRVLGC